MKKFSFFSIPRNKTRKDNIEVIKDALTINGWKFVEKSERSKKNFKSLQKSYSKSN